MSIKLKTTITEIVSALLIFLFVYVAINKLINHDQFVYALKQSPIMPGFITLVSWVIPITELVVSLFLFIPKLRALGLLLSAFLMSAFTFYVAGMLLFAPQLPCSCGGVIQQLNWHQHMLFNILFTLLAYMGFIFSKHPKSFIAISR